MWFPWYCSMFYLPYRITETTIENETIVEKTQPFSFKTEKEVKERNNPASSCVI